MGIFHLLSSAKLLIVLAVLTLSCTESNPNYDPNATANRTPSYQFNSLNDMTLNRDVDQLTTQNDAMQTDMLAGDMIIGDMLMGDMLVDDMLVGDMLVGDMLIGDMLIGDMLIGDMLMVDMLMGDMLTGDMACVDCDGDGVTREDGDCDDYNSRRSPLLQDRCDSIDNDCDTRVDEYVSSCYSGEEQTLGNGTCSAGTRQCRNGMATECEGEILPRAEECFGPLAPAADEDCDGSIDEQCDFDQDRITVDEGDCDDNNRDVNPNAPEVCNGIDDNCNQEVDEIRLSCYTADPSTQNRGLCRSGFFACIDGALGECEGQITPNNEICDTQLDEDCDGQVDENCVQNACSTLDPTVEVSVSTSCLTAGTWGRALVQVTPRLANQAPITDDTQIDLQLQIQPNAQIRSQSRINNTWYWEIQAPVVEGDLQLTVLATCGDGEQLTFQQRPIIEVLRFVRSDDAINLHGCQQQEGNLYVEVKDEETGLAIPSVHILIGDQAQNIIQSNAALAVQNQEGTSSNVFITNASGRRGIYDFSDFMRGPQTITVGAAGYENVTIYDANSEYLGIKLRPIDLPNPPIYSLRGNVANFNNTDRRIFHLSLVLPSFSIERFTSTAVTNLLSRLECWDSLGGFTLFNDDIAVPGNLYVPSQTKRYSFFNLNVNEHPFYLQDIKQSNDHVLALAGEIPVDDVVDAVSNNEFLSTIFSKMSFNQIGVRLNQNLNDSTQSDQSINIPLNNTLNENASCSVANEPAGSYVTCLTGGRWTQLAGDRVFPMGLTNLTVEDLASGVRRRNLTTVRQEGEFQSIEYFGAAVALYTSNDPQKKEAVSALIQREGLDEDGGTIEASSFLKTSSIYQESQEFSWDSLTHNQSPAVDLCEVELRTVRRTPYNPGSCAGNYVYRQSAPLWRNYTLGNRTQVDLPTLPNSWPRSAFNGLQDPASLSDQERLEVRLKCQSFDQESPINFNRFTTDNLQPSHITLNQVIYQE